MQLSAAARRAASFVFVIVLIAAAGAAVALRAAHLGRAPFWLDEAYSAYAADHGWRFLWHVVPRYETHPPLYYSLVHLWSLAFGETVLARRLLGVVAGVAAVGAGGLAASALARLLDVGTRERRWLIGGAAALLAVQPLMVEMSRQVRPYPVMTLVYAVAITALLGLARDTAEGRGPDRRRLALVLACEAAMCWLHSLGPLYGGTIALALGAVVLRRGLARRDWAWLLGGQIIVALVYLPGALILADQSTEWIAATWLKFRPHLLEASLGSLYATWNHWAMALGALLAAVGLVRLLADRRGWRAGVALVLLAVLPTLLSLAISILVSPVFLVRTLAPCTVPGLLLMARGAAWRRWLRWPALILLAGEVALMGWLALAFARARPAQDWYGTARYLAARWTPGDRVWAYPNEGALPLDYALKDLRLDRTIVTVPIPTAVPAIGAGGYYPTGSRGVVSLYPAEIARLAASPAATQPETIWLLRMGAATYDPGDRLLKAIEASRVRVGSWRTGPIEIIGLRKLAANAAGCKIVSGPGARAAAAAVR